MARRKKDGRRATGIQAKKGYLYIVLSVAEIKDGTKKTVKQWIPTKLSDSPDNVIKASSMRLQLINKTDILSVDPQISISAYVDLYLAQIKRNLKDNTYTAYFYRGKKIKDYFGDIKIKDINRSMVESFLDSMFEDDNLQPRSVKDIKTFFNSMMKHALSNGVILYNPVPDVIINKQLIVQYSKDKDEADEFFSYEEAILFLQHVTEHELYELFYLTLFFGLRREEVLGLRWQVINFRNKTMTINHTVTIGSTITRSNITKTEASERVYPLSDEQIDMFQKMKERELRYRKLFGNGYFDSDYIFKHEDGTLYYPDYPTKAFGKLIKKIPNLPQSITFHGLRSSCVSILVHQGMDIKAIQKWVGHKDLDTTLRIYAKVKEKESKREISDAMTDIIPLKEYKE